MVPIPSDPPRSHVRLNAMKRLIQICGLLMVLATFLAPMAEYFDRWDSPGMSTDTEFAVFAVILILCLVLLVSKLIASLSMVISLTVTLYPRHHSQSKAFNSSCTFATFPPSLSAPPLRI
jgi:hypothetical protein